MLTKLMPVARVKVLAFLLMNAPKAFYLREIARRSGVPLRSVQREVELLEDIALIERERRGKQVFVHVRMSHPLFSDLHSLLVKTEGLAIPLRCALEKVGGVEAAAVYGSVASGTDTGESDIDLLVVGSLDELVFHDAVSVIEEELGRPVNYSLMTPTEIRNRLGKDDPFLARVLGGKLIPLIGDLHDF